jgi:hypothetical protein
LTPFPFAFAWLDALHAVKHSNSFVNAGLLMYLDLERKPDNGGKIQNIADVASEIMLRLKIVKSAKEEKAIAAGNTDDDLVANEERHCVGQQTCTDY